MLITAIMAAAAIPATKLKRPSPSGGVELVEGIGEAEDDTVAVAEGDEVGSEESDMTETDQLSICATKICPCVES